MRVPARLASEIAAPYPACLLACLGPSGRHRRTRPGWPAWPGREPAQLGRAETGWLLGLPVRRFRP